MFTYKLVLEDGTPADPATFVSALPSWHEGDKVLIHPGFEFEIVAIDEQAEDGPCDVDPSGDASEAALVTRLGSTFTCLG